MKKLFILATAVSLLAACNNAPKADEATTGERQEETTATGTPYAVDSSSTVTWTGTKPTGSHTGTFAITSGELMVSDTKLTGGNFTFNIAGMKNTDLDADGAAKLVGHLQSPDFFDVAKYPTASFVITSVEDYVADSTAVMKDATHKITGNLTLKDQTKSVSFPAKVTVDASTAAAMAEFNIDRTLWGMNYKGPDNPQDWVIKKEVNIKVDLRATKK